MFNFKASLKSSKALIILAVAMTAATATWLVGAQSVIPKTIELSTSPLYAASTGDKPTLTLALSVEYPTVGAQYMDDDYSNSNEYLGYYDAESCYKYNNTPTETIAADKVASDYKRFDFSSKAKKRMCEDAFSGNFLNWSSSSAVDMMRLALSGGDRSIDSETLTILQRAVLPTVNGVSYLCFFNNETYFPPKKLDNDGGDSKVLYWGAIPKIMQTKANKKDVWVANGFNRIYFGTSKSGRCGTNILGTNTPYKLGPASVEAEKRNVGPALISNSPLPNNAKSCGVEGSDCDFTGVHEVWYGASVTVDIGNGKSSVTNNYWIVAPASEGVSCNNSTFIDPIPYVTKSCYYIPSDYKGAWKVPDANSEPYFFSRVQVCNASPTGELVDVRDYNFCTQYPNGKYKPTGSIQKYSDQLRLAAFGYLLDQSSSHKTFTQLEYGRYGGVLRAPMEFVGQKTFDSSGQETTPVSGNPNAEWDKNTGILALNPRGDTTQNPPISGAINYLNKFGRTGELGTYKMNDSLGELYGESLRYLQGLPPTPEAVKDIKPEMYDGFPVYAKWDTDPYGGGRDASADYTCLKTNIVTVGDVYTHDSDRLFTRPSSLSKNLPNFSSKGWKGTVADFEQNDQTKKYIDGQGTEQKIYNPNSRNMSDQAVAYGSQVLTGQAYWARTHDIRGADWTASPSQQRRGLRVKSYFFDVNSNGGSVTDPDFRHNRNQFFTAAKYGGFETDASNLGGKPYNTFGNPFKRQNGVDDNDVWQDPQNLGEASSYFVQSDGRAVLQAFDSIFSSAAQTSRNIAGSSIANKDLTAANTLVYQATFDASDWTGDVLAFPIKASGGAAAISTNPSWRASDRLTLMKAQGKERSIFVGSSDVVNQGSATKFLWNDIDKSLKDNLAKISPIAIADDAATAEKRLEYLRGDTSDSRFRSRKQLLGDIVNSGVVYSGAPVVPTRTTVGFPEFQTKYALRKPAVFAGSNDGMLHAFDALNGDELFGYIPGSMGPKLAALTAPTYNANHQLYVDATPVVAETKVASNGKATDWKTVLVSGLGGGATGVFALDVSDPFSFNERNAMWEFTRANDADMGFVVGTPRIITLRTSGPATTPPIFQSFVAVASGVNNYVTGNKIIGGAGNPTLFLLAINKPAGERWTLSGPTPNYYKITVPFDSTLIRDNATGLVNFTPAIGFDGVTEKIYMGDLHGKLWKLDFASANINGPADWTMEKLSSFNKGTKASPAPYPFYTAKTATGLMQPITMAPLLAAGPVIDGLATTIVGFGTGKYLEAGDKTSTLQNSFYAVFDDGTVVSDGGNPVSSAVSGRNRLQQGLVDSNTLKVNVSAFRVGRAPTDAAAGTPPLRSGWYFDFPVSGERIISSGSIIGNSFFLSSLIPASAGAAGSCTASGVSGNSYELNIDSGDGLFERSSVGLLGQTLLVKVSEINETSDSTGKGLKTTKYQKIRIGSEGAIISPDKFSDSVVNRRLTWRQINNYQDLRLGK